jgi:hypothetical protein
VMAEWLLTNKEAYLKKLKIIAAFLIMVLILVSISCGRKNAEINSSQAVSILEYAKPYQVVGKGNLHNEDEQRTVGLWYVTSEEADSLEEYAQTALQATIDLYKKYEYTFTFTAVMLVPRPGVTIWWYAEAFYAADGKGGAGMTGSAPAKPEYWNVRVMDDVPYNEQELAVLELWQDKQADFPSRNYLSSLSYDEKALRQYIADTLKISYEEAQPRYLKMVEYPEDEAVSSLIGEDPK